MKKVREYRAMARETLKHSIFSTPWLMLLVAIVVEGAILSAVSFSGIGTLILMGPLAFGLAAFSLNLVRSNGENADLVQEFSGFKRFSDTLITGLLYYLFILLWSLLFIIPGIIKSYAYSMTFYLMNDDPNLSGNDAITKSRQLMKGHKWKLFVLDLSFIGWWFVGMLCFGIGTLWVAAYQEAAHVHFYEDLIKDSKEEKAVEPEIVNE